MTAPSNSDTATTVNTGRPRPDESPPKKSEAPQPRAATAASAMTTIVLASVTFFHRRNYFCRFSLPAKHLLLVNWRSEADS
jgi:hypothetical protein